MKKLKIVLFILLISIVLIGLFYAGWKFAQPKKQEKKVTAQVILTSLHERGFLVTQTYMFDEPITIEKSEGSVWKDFFFGQTIEARGNMEVNMGVDLQNVTASDIEITAEKIIVTLPSAEIFNTRLVGPIDLKNKQGILKKIVDNEDGYNEAMTELVTQAEKAASDSNMIKIASEQAVAEVKTLLELVVKNKEIEVVLSPEKLTE